MRLLFTLALRNLIAHRIKSLVVGGIMVFGTMLLVVGLALVDGVETAMKKAITQSVAGDLQLYDSEAKDDLLLLGSTMISVPDVGSIERFERVQTVVQSVSGIQALVPMGVDIGTIVTPGPVDRAIESLKTAETEVERSRARLSLQELLKEIEAELEQQKRVSDRPDRAESDLRALTLNWDDLEENRPQFFEHLETKVAPLGSRGEQLLFRFLGTDYEQYARVFPHFSIVRGTPVPKGRRGFLFSEKYYDRRVKHRVAREFDNIIEALEDGDRILEDDAQKGRVRRMARQWRRITRQLDHSEAAKLKVELEDYLGTKDDLPALLERFLTVADDNVHERQHWFVKNIGPKIEMYRLRPGDTVTVRAYTKSGFLRSVNVVFYGTFTFEGLESSDLAGVYNFIDLVSFRYLHGVMDESELSELEALRKEVGLQDLEDGAALEEAMFGGDASVLEAADQKAQIEIEEAQFEGEAERGLPSMFDPKAVRAGLVLNAAVVLEPGADQALVEASLEEALEKAQLPLQVATWKEVSGLLGQFVIVVRLVLYVAMAVIFVVAIVIINNAMVMAMMERVKEVGTLRAIGAQRSMVLSMVMVEITTLGVVAGSLGAALGGSLVWYWGLYGLPAPNREFMFVFGGPELFPQLQNYHLGVGFMVILMVSLISAAYPAVLGASVPPVEAMRGDE